MSLARTLALLAALALLAPAALAQQPEANLPPGNAHILTVGNATLSYWVGPSAGAVDEDVDEGDNASLWFGIVGGNTSRFVAHLNVTTNVATLGIANGSVSLDAAPGGYDVTNVTFVATVADGGRLTQNYSFAGQMFEDQNGTLVLLGPFSGTGTFTMDVGTNVPLPPLPEPGIPTSWIIIGGAVVVVGGLGGALALRQRGIRRRMNEGPRRSQVMRDMELEERMEKAKAKDPEKAVVIQQEIRAAEGVREKRRELQILEAKRSDALKTIELLKKRHETGGLTKLQYDNMVGKKRQDLARIEADIAAMEGHDPSAAS